MTDIPFKAGDVVRVKSGGPDMTVTQTGTRSYTDEPLVWCVWFDGKKKYDDTFAPDALVLATEDPTPRVVTGRRVRPTHF